MHYGGQSTSQVQVAMVEALYRSKVRFFRKHYHPAYAALFCALLWVVLRLRWLVRSVGKGEAIGPPMSWPLLWGTALPTAQVR